MNLLKKNQKIDIIDDDGIIALANIQTYNATLSFRENWTWRELNEHLLDKNKESLFVFSTGGEDEWTLKFLINEESKKSFFRKTEQYLEVTDNVLYVVSWGDLTCTLQFRDTMLPDKFNKDLKVKVSNGLYRVVVKQLFDPEDYEYDAENKVNFIVELFSVESTNKNKLETIAWSENFPNDDKVFLSPIDSDTADFLEKLINNRKE